MLSCFYLICMFNQTLIHSVPVYFKHALDNSQRDVRRICGSADLYWQETYSSQLSSVTSSSVWV